MKKILFTALMLVTIAVTSVAQIVTTTPAILQESSENVVLTYHADSPLGNGELAGLNASTPVYAHIGVITDKSDGQWVYAPEWLDNSDKFRLTYAGTNTWTLSLGTIRSYFGITDPTEHVQRIAMVLRNADASKTGRTASGGDIFVDVAEEGFQMSFTQNTGRNVISAPTTIIFTVNTTAAATIDISVNGKSVASTTGQTVLSAPVTFSEHGAYTVTATATHDGRTLTKVIGIAYPGQSTAGTYPGGVPKMGAVRNADGTVTFCLAAPGKESVVLVGSWDNYDVLEKNVMKYQDYQGQRYFFTTVSGLSDHEYYPYYYIVDATYKVGDPYARLVLDCYSDKWLDATVWPEMPRYPYDKFDDVMLAVYRGDIESDFEFSPFTIPSKDNLVIYEMLIRDFTGTEGEARGEGTLRKAMDKLYYLKSLGVNAIELMPVMESNGNNSWGYNTNFYMAPDKAYGSPEDLKRFINVCHEMGMAVILDIVFNQSDGLHPWYQMYDPADNPFYNAKAPHDYSVLNDWRQENPLVRQQWKDTLKFWLTVYNVDGFRFDLVKGLGTSYPNGTEAYNQTRVDGMKELHAAMKAVKPDAIHINENLAAAQEENAMAADGQLNWANRTCYYSQQYAMGYAADSNLAAFLSTADQNRTAFSTVAYAESHDEQRLAYKQAESGANGIKGNATASVRRLGHIAAQMLLTPGPKMIWQFGEFGADENTKNGGGNNTDPKKVVWSYLDRSENKALHDIYKALCNLRKMNPELFAADAAFATTGFANSLTSMRTMRLTAGTKEVICFINPNISGVNRTVGTTSTLLNQNNAQLICATPGFTPTLRGTGTSVSVSVPANSLAVFATTSTSDVDTILPDGSATTVTVSARPGEIVLSGAYTTARIYSMGGMLTATASGNDSVSVAPGLYIVNVDGNLYKVAVP